jgi:hypothetical protein
MLVQSRPASRPVIGGAPARAVLDPGPGWAVGDVDRVTGCALDVLDPAGLGVAVTVAVDPGTLSGVGALPPQAASAASDPAISTARAAWSILTS